MSEFLIKFINQRPCIPYRKSHLAIKLIQRFHDVRSAKHEVERSTKHACTPRTTYIPSQSEPLSSANKHPRMAIADSCPCCLPCACARSDDGARERFAMCILTPPFILTENKSEREQVDQKGDAVMCLKQGAYDTASRRPAAMNI